MSLGKWIIAAGTAWMAWQAIEAAAHLRNDIEAAKDAEQKQADALNGMSDVPAVAAIARPCNCQAHP